MRKRTQVNQITDSNPMIIEWTVMRKIALATPFGKSYSPYILEIRIAGFHCHAIENKNQNRLID